VKSSRLITAVKTPYSNTGRIDLNSLDNLIKFQIKNGVDGIIVGGTTGEGHLKDIVLVLYPTSEKTDAIISFILLMS
jgi:4-hydroxy-tetrahydrodipicolinate synthase